MDAIRQIRFLIPPFYLYASLAGYALADPQLRCYLLHLGKDDTTKIFSAISALGALTIPLGYTIGTVTIFFLKISFSLVSLVVPRKRLYEASISEAAFLIISRETESSGEPSNLLYATATFDHQLLPDKVHEWIVRRWNSFNVAANSTMAILLSMILTFMLTPDPFHCWTMAQTWWLVVNSALAALLAIIASISWAETMKMIEFQAERKGVYKLKSRR